MPVKKLMVQGIRAFSPKIENVIEFSPPLTLIVGPNGSGKTTVIESLKYALTGIFPPNSKGGAFVHDPKLLKAPDTRAEIRLRFNDVSGRSLVVKRVLQATERSGKLFQKTLETELIEERCGSESNRDKETRILASKLCDVDPLVPTLIGATSALIESVIFCHQEESGWPLGEPRILKERLDQIFCSTRYSKALKAMKDARKGVCSGMKVLEERLSALKREKARKDELCSELNRAEEESSNLAQSLRRTKEERERVTRVLMALRKDEEAYAVLEKNYRALISEMDACVNFIKTFRHEVLDRRKIIRCRSELGIPADFADDGGESDSSTIRNSLVLLRQALASKASEYKEIDLNSHESALRELETVLQDLSHALLISKEKEEAQAKKSRVLAAISKINQEMSKETFKKAKEEEETLRRKIKELERKIFEQKTYSSAVDRFEKENAEILDKYVWSEYNGSNLTSTNILDLQNKLMVDSSSIGKANLHITRLSGDIRAAEGNIQRLQEAICTELSQIGDITSVVNRIHDLEQELQESSTDEAQHGELLEKRKTFEAELEKDRQKKTQVRIVMGRIISNINEIEELWCENKTLHQVEELKVILKAIGGLRHQLSDLEVVPEVFQKAIHVIEEHRKDVSGTVCESDAIEVLQTEIQEVEKKIVSSSCAEAIYKNFKELGNARKGCPLCKTRFDTTALELFNKKLGYAIIEIPKKVSELQERLQVLTERKAAAEENLELRKQKEDATSSILAKVSKVVQGLYEVAELYGGCRETSENVLAEYKSLEKKLCKLESRIENCSRLQSEISLLRRKVISKAKRLNGMCESEIPSDDEIIKLLSESLEDKRKKLAEWKGKRDKAAEQMTILTQAAASAQERMAVCSWLAKKKVLSDSDLSLLEEEAGRTEEKLAELSQVIARSCVHQQRVEELRTELSVLKKKEEKASDRLSKLLQKIIGTLRHMKDNLGSSNNRDGYCNTGYETLSSESDNLEAHLSSLIEALESSKAFMMELRRENVAKLCLLQKVSEMIIVVDENIKLHNCEERVVKIESEFGDFDVKKKQRLKERIETFRTKEAEIASKESMLVGELKQNEARKKQMKEDLERNYSSTNKEYVRCSLELKASEISIKDMDKCIQALDKAIVEYHTAKIEEVNSKLRELWEDTYKGGDVERIELRSDSTDLRSCGYGIFMVKKGTAVEMRGRCSAGQKSIASILVRIALAESFSAGCNALALDEPTTNLDKPNMKSLAEVLARIVTKRKDMQLIVITHDEEFVNMLGCEGVEHFYRLRRNTKGESIIERHSVLFSDII